jgi:putative DNA methylase
MDREVIGRVAEKKTSPVIPWDSATRAAKGALGPADGSRGLIDSIHHAAHLGRTRGLQSAHDLLERSGIAAEPLFLCALEAVLEVLPPSRAFTGFDPAESVAPFLLPLFVQRLRLVRNVLLKPLQLSRQRTKAHQAQPSLSQLR